MSNNEFEIMDGLKISMMWHAVVSAEMERSKNAKKSRINLTFDDKIHRNEFFTKFMNVIEIDFQ